jgi:hypothetical protein
MISVEQQFAEKLHSYTLPRDQINTRAKDLIDMILLLQYKNREPKAFQNAMHKVFRVRKTHSLPQVLPEPPISWQKPFAKMTAECGISQTLKDGFTKVFDFYNALQEMSKNHD